MTNFSGRMTFGWRRRALVLAAVAALAVGAASAEEGEGDKTVTEELLDILLQSGTIDESRYEDLKERARREEQQRAEAAAAAREAAEQATAAAATADEADAPAMSSSPTDWSIKWKNGFRVERNDGLFKFAFGGRIQNDWAVVQRDSELDDAGFDNGNGTEFRRARIFFSGTAWEHLYFKAQYDFANTGDGNTDFKDVYIGLRKLGPLGEAEVGHFKEPVSLQQLTSSKYLTFMERALPDALVPGRNTGLGFRNTLFDGRLLWQLAGFRESNDVGFGFDDDRDYNITFRLSGAPYYANGGERVLHLGAAYTHQFRDNFTLRYSSRPEANLADRIVDTQDIPADGIDLFVPELALVWGPASLQAEYVGSWVEGDGVSNTKFWGTYVEASYFLTGEHRNYEFGKGRFGRLTPKENFSTKNGTWGAWQVATRFSYLDLDDDFVEGGKVWDITAGLNWYPYPNARVMLNYIRSHLEDRNAGAAINTDVDGDANVAQVRFQVDF